MLGCKTHPAVGLDRCASPNDHIEWVVTKVGICHQYGRSAMDILWGRLNVDKLRARRMSPWFNVTGAAALAACSFTRRTS